MTAVVTVHDESPSGEKLHTLKLRLEGERITVRDLIARRVQQEAAKFNLERPVNFHALVQPAEAQETANGFRLPRHRDVDWQKQAEAAYQAFEKTNLAVLLDGKPASSLDDDIIIGRHQISFLKLMPVVGG